MRSLTIDERRERWANVAIVLLVASIAAFCYGCGSMGLGGVVGPGQAADALDAVTPVVAGAANMLLPGAGGVVALLLGYGAAKLRGKQVEKKKAGSDGTPPVEPG